MESGDLAAPLTATRDSHVTSQHLCEASWHDGEMVEILKTLIKSWHFSFFKKESCVPLENLLKFTDLSFQTENIIVLHFLKGYMSRQI